ncbi:MAG TPA: hypothetical protein VGG61_14230 [Gemmataceae bacterium]
MTLLKESKTVSRQTAISYRGRPLMVKLGPRTIEVREKGRRDSVSVSYDAIYELGYKLRWLQQKAG